MAEFLPADHWKEEVSSRKHTRPAPTKDSGWDFLRGAGPSAPEVRTMPAAKTALPQDCQAQCVFPLCIGS